MRPLEKVCKVGTVAIGGGQGAPVAVTKIEQRMLSEEGSVKPQFIIHIRNLGRGTVVRADKVDLACSGQAVSSGEQEQRERFLNTVTLEDIRFSEFSYTGGHFDCVPVDQQTGAVAIRLKDGEGLLKCTLKAGLLSAERQAYATSLQVRLRYGYFQTVARDVLLERLLS
jgi:hypothetical protein